MLGCVFALIPAALGVLELVLGGLPDRWGRWMPMTPKSAATLEGLTAVGFCVGVSILLWRWSLVSALFARGVQVPAKVVRVWFLRDRGRIEYEYEIQGAVHRAGVAVQKSRVTAGFAPGQAATTLADSARPARSLLLALYAEDPARD